MDSQIKGKEQEWPQKRNDSEVWPTGDMIDTERYEGVVPVGATVAEGPMFPGLAVTVDSSMDR